MNGLGRSAPRRDTRNLARLAWLLDDALPIPGTPWRIGVDAVIGLVPGVGDAIGALFSTYIIVQAARCGASVWTVTRMLGNVAVETLIGVVPVVGDLFDVVWKSNVWNLALLDAALTLERPPRDPEGVLRLAMVIIAIVMLGVVAATGLAAVVLYRALLG